MGEIKRGRRSLVDCESRTARRAPAATLRPGLWGGGVDLGGVESMHSYGAAVAAQLGVPLLLLLFEEGDDLGVAELRRQLERAPG